MDQDYFDEIDASITVSNVDGIIIYMNAKARKTFQKQGGADLIGKNIFDCHPESAKEKLKGIMTTEQSNTYTIEKNGIRKIIHQKPWYTDGRYMGFVEMSFEIPLDMPHFVRK